MKMAQGQGEMQAGGSWEIGIEIIWTHVRLLDIFSKQLLDGWDLWMISLRMESFEKDERDVKDVEGVMKKT